MSTVFISYRRDDSAPWAGRLCDRLSAAFGQDRVFMDVEDIPAGADFAKAIAKTVGACDVLVAVIGPRWLEMLRDRSVEQDFVREEIGAALTKGLTVIPVFVGGAEMPAERDLPPELSALARRQAMQFRDDSFGRNTDDLIRTIRSAVAGGRSSKRLAWMLVAIGIVIAIAGSAVFLINARERASLDGNWIARMQPPTGRPYTLRLTFQTDRQKLTGTVEYPTGGAAIQGGTFRDNRLSFYTRHVPQFESEPATLLLSGRLRGRELDLTLTSQDGRVSKGTARKTE